MKKILSLLMALSLTISLSLPVAATAPTAPATSTTSTATTTTTEEKPAIQTKKPETVAGAYVVMDAKSGQILVEKDMNKKLSPASITKILTAAIALEVGDPTDTYEITADDVFSYKFPGTTYVALTHDEIVTVEQLLYGTLMASANDAANCLGSYVATKLNRTALNAEGKESYVSGFVEILNEKLKEIGCTDTHFTNAHGLYNEDHYTTAADMAKITQYALSQDGFEEYFGAVSYKMAPTNKQPQERSWGTQSGLFVESNQYYYEGATGAKLGYTDESGHTMVSVASRKGVELICVIMDCQQGNWADHKDTANLYDYCFDNFSTVTFTSAELKQRTVPVYKDNVIYEKAKITSNSDHSLQLHKSLSKKDILMTSDAPGRYFDGESKKANLNFTLSKSALKKIGDAMYTELGSIGLDVEVVPLVEKSNSFSAKVLNFILLLLKVFAVIVLVLVVLVLVLRYYNIRRYRRIKEQRKRRQMEREANQNNSTLNQ